MTTPEKSKTTSKSIDMVLLAVVLLLVAIYLPWWALAVPTALYGALRFKHAWALQVAAIASAASWLGPALFYDFETGFRISSRMSKLTLLGFPIFFFVLLALIAALTGVLGSLLGASLRRAVSARQVR